MVERVAKTVRLDVMDVVWMITLFAGGVAAGAG